MTAARRAARGGIGAALLAAGSSRRMGTPKGLLPWAGKALLEHQIDVLLAADVGEIVVVLGAAVDDLENVVIERSRVRVVWNALHNLGRSGSVAIATLALKKRAAIMFCNLDQPLSARLVSDLTSGAEKAPDYPIAVPTYRGARGHPILIRKDLYEEVLTVSEAAEGLRSVIRRRTSRIIELATESANACIGFNTPAEYDRAVSMLEAGELDRA